MSPASPNSLLTPVALGLVVACGGEPRVEGPRLVVLYSTCTLSREFVSPYASEVDYTPNLQRFADEGLVFERHNTEAGQSGVAFASIFSGVQADRHGVYHHPDELPEELYLATEAFGDAGYRPYYWSGQGMASAEYGYGQGVEAADVHHTHIEFTKKAKPLPPGFLEGTTLNSPEFDAVLERLRTHPEAGAFVQASFTITHELYHEYANLETIAAFREAHPRFATDYSSDEVAQTLEFFEEHRHRLQLDHPNAVRELGLTPADLARLDAVLQLAYRACVAQLDDYFGRFLERIDAAGLADESLIVFTADHGETFLHPSEPLHWTHGLQLAPSVLAVPLIVRGGSVGIQPGRYAEVTRSIDVYPTLAGLAGVRLPEGVELDGVDLSEAVLGRAPRPELLAFSHTSTLGETRVERYRRGGYTEVRRIMPEPEAQHIWVRVRARDMVWEQRGELHEEPRAFDLARDPRRAHDVYDATDPEHARMVERLQAYRKRLITGFDGEELDQRRMLNALQGLGYVGE